MQRTKNILLLTLTFLFVLSACSAQSTQTPPTVAPAPVVEPGHPLTSGDADLPLNETEVPRVSIEDARAALERGAAVIVDVRNPDAFEASHIAGAISVPLGEIELNPVDLPLDENQWIITYCT